MRVRSRWGPVGCLLDSVAFVTSFRSLRYVTGLSACCRASRGGFGVFVVDSCQLRPIRTLSLCLVYFFSPYDTVVLACDGVETCVAAGALVWRCCQSLGYFPHLGGARRRQTRAAGCSLTAGTSAPSWGISQRPSWGISAPQAGNHARRFERETRCYFCPVKVKKSNRLRVIGGSRND